MSRLLAAARCEPKTYRQPSATTTEGPCAETSSKDGSGRWGDGGRAWLRGAARAPTPAAERAAVEVTSVRRDRVLISAPGGVGSRGVPPGGRRERGPTSSRGLARGSARALRGEIGRAHV